MKTRLIRGAAALAAVAALAACAPEPVPTLEPVPSPTAPLPALDDASIQEILEDAEALLVEADAVSSTETLSGRFDGPALFLRAAEYQQAAASEGAVPITPLDLTPQLEIVSATFEWPRVVTMVSEIPEGANVPLLFTMVQADARSDYKIWSYVRLFGGLTLPATTTSELGSPPVAADDTSLLLSPAETLERYADVVNLGEESEYAGLFTADPYREAWAETNSQLATTIEEAGVSSQHTAPAPSGTVSIGTADGGAIVMGSFDQHIEVQRTEADSTLVVGDRLANYGETEVAGSLRTNYFVTMAFYVPPAGSSEQIQVLGAEQVVLAASHDESTNPD